MRKIANHSASRGAGRGRVVAWTTRSPRQYSAGSAAGLCRLVRVLGLAWLRTRPPAATSQPGDGVAGSLYASGGQRAAGRPNTHDMVSSCPESF